MKHRTWIFVSQSPEGYADDFHFSPDPRGVGDLCKCLNPPKGTPTISTECQQEGIGQLSGFVSIPRRVRRRFPRLCH